MHHFNYCLLNTMFTIPSIKWLKYIIKIIFFCNGSVYCWYMKTFMVTFISEFFHGDMPVYYRGILAQLSYDLSPVQPGWCVYAPSCTLAALLELWSCEDWDLSLPLGHISSLASPTAWATFSAQFPLSPCFSSRPPLSRSGPSCMGQYRGFMRVWKGPPSSFEWEKLPKTELLIQSGEQYAQLGIHKDPGWVQGPCRGQAVQSLWGINCGWQCVNSGVNRQRRCETTRPFSPPWLCCHFLFHSV